MRNKADDALGGMVTILYGWVWVRGVDAVCMSGQPVIWCSQ